MRCPSQDSLGQELAGRVRGQVGGLDVEGVAFQMRLPGREIRARIDEALEHADVVRRPDVVGMLKGLVYSGTDLSAWKTHLKGNPFDIKPAYLATHTAGKLLPQTILGRASHSPQLPQSVMVQ